MPEHPEHKERAALGAHLDRLFDDIRPYGPHGRRYTNEEVATAIKRTHPGIRVGGAYLSALRKGTKRNPSTELLTALARFFGVPTSSLLDEEFTEPSDTEVELARVAHNLGVRHLALRALELSPEGLAAVTRIVEDVLEGDGLRAYGQPRADDHPPGSRVPEPRRPHERQTYDRQTYDRQAYDRQAHDRQAHDRLAGDRGPHGPEPDTDPETESVSEPDTASDPEPASRVKHQRTPRHPSEGR